MVNKENTIYEIRYDFDLGGAEISIPEGCVLDFQGGSFSNGTVNINGAKIIPNGCVISNYITANISGGYANGQCLFDEILGKPKYWLNTKWIDATGADV